MRVCKEKADMHPASSWVLHRLRHTHWCRLYALVIETRFSHVCESNPTASSISILIDASVLTDCSALCALAQESSKTVRLALPRARITTASPVPPAAVPPLCSLAHGSVIPVSSVTPFTQWERDCRCSYWLNGIPTVEAELEQDCVARHLACSHCVAMLEVCSGGIPSFASPRIISSFSLPREAYSEQWTQSESEL